MDCKVFKEPLVPQVNADILAEEVQDIQARWVIKAPNPSDPRASKDLTISISTLVPPVKATKVFVVLKVIPILLSGPWDILVLDQPGIRVSWELPELMEILRVTQGEVRRVIVEEPVISLLIPL